MPAMNKKLLLKQLISTLDADSADDQEVIDYLNNYEFIKINRTAEIQDGSLVQLENQGNINWYFMIPVEGGKFLTIDDKVIMSITPFSKLGGEMINRIVGDEFEVQAKSSIQTYKVLHLC